MIALVARRIGCGAVRRRALVLGLAALVWVTAGCRSSDGPEGTATTTSLEGPDAPGPAAGSCALARGEVATVIVRADMVPSPRCVVVRHDQRLRVTNRSGGPLEPRLGARLHARVGDGASVTLPGPLGRYLAPGVHRLVFTAASAADIWVDAVCRGEGGADCVTPTT